MRNLWTMTASDLRQHVRDRSVIIFALVVPLALMVVFNLVFGGVEDLELKPVTVAVAAPADDELAGVVVRSLSDLDVLDVTVEETPAAEVRSRAESGDAQLGVIVPAGFGAAVMSGQGAVVDVVQGNDGGIEASILTSVVRGVVDQLAAGSVTAAAGARLGVPPEELSSLAQQAATAGPAVTLAEGAVSNEQLSGAASLVAGQSGLFLLFTVGFGVLGLVHERDTGTLARLRSMPMRPGLIVAGKALVSFVLGLVATAVLLTAGSLLFDVSFGSPPAVAVLVVVAVAAATSLMFIIVRLARTSEQANILQSILALLLGIAGGAFFPIAVSGSAGQLLDLNPIAAFIRGLGITSGGGGLADIGVPVAIMVGFALACLAISRVIPDRGAGQ
jgi:ABC-2 type transport system permease protein